MNSALYTATLETIEPATPTVKLFRLRCADTSFYRLAGQWINVYHETGGQFYSASFSVASSPTDAGLVELAIRFSAHHPLTLWLHKQAQPGDQVKISHGQGSFIYRPEMGKRVVLIGAGTGITPMLSIARFIADSVPQTDATLLYSIASTDEFLYRTEIEQLTQLSNIHSLVTLTQPDARWQGTTGRIGEQLLRQAGLDAHTLYYLCGPQAMVDEVSERLVALGVPAQHTIYEKWW